MAWKYQAYPEYKDSGVEWLGEVPDHWSIKKLKYICTVQTGDKDTVNAVDDGDYPFFVRSQTVERINSVGANCEAVLTAGDGVGVGKVFHYYEGKFDYHQRVYMLNSFSNVLGRFVFYYLSNNFYKVALEGNAKSTVDSLRLPQFLNFEFSLPDLGVQQKIANFLDHETAKIDTLIDKQQQLIKLLKEKRQAVISHAVTKGLNPNAPMRDSGVEWLGEVPEHWDVKKFTHCASIRNGQVNPTKDPYCDFTLVAPNHIESGTGRLIAQETAAEQGADSGKYLCKEGEVIYSKIRPALAKVCISPSDNTICSADMYPIQGVSGLTNEFLFWSLLSTWFTSLVILESDRVAMPKINREKLAEVMLPVPPEKEQKEINTEIKNKTEAMDALIQKAEMTITLAKERRTALISAAVTGKIDVRGWVAPAHPCARDMSASMHVTTPESSRKKTHTKETVA